MTYLVSVEAKNPFGICLGEDYVVPSNGSPYVGFFNGNNRAGLTFRVDGPDSQDYPHRWELDYNQLAVDLARQTYDIPDDAFNISGSYAADRNFLYRTSRRFDTEAEALAYVDTLGNPEPLVEFEDGDTLFYVRWTVTIEGLSITTRANLVYSGDPVTLYTAKELRDFLIIFFGANPEEFNYEYSSDTGEVNPPSLDCDPYLRVKVIDVGELNPDIVVDIDFDGSSSIPGDVVVTVTDGDPGLVLTEIVNGDGSVTIADNGNINMSNDGGTFYLNEFGNAGFFANGDASLTANTQVQLGSGGTTFNVDSNGLNMRDSTGTVSFTADELSRLKDLLD